MKIWLDDIREAPPGWTRTYTVSQTIQLLRTGQVSELSLDYDLPETDPGHTGDEVLEWLKIRLAQGKLPAPVIHVHSINPYGSGKMAYLIGRMERHHGWQPMRVQRALPGMRPDGRRIRLADHLYARIR